MRELCPSGPYCWQYGRVGGLLPNLGLRMAPLGMAMATEPAQTKAGLETRVREALDRGDICAMLHLDNQLILGYDESGFDLALPWGETVVDSTPARLSAGTWQEVVNGPPATFFAFAPCEPRRESAAIAASLDFAVEAWQCPEGLVLDGYGFGRLAYDNWLAGLDAGHGEGHGNWWNGVVWAECRERAGDYFQDLAAADYPGPLDQRQARQLAVDYRAIGRLLYRAADKTASVDDKKRFVGEARDLEAGCVERIADIRSH